MKKIIDSFVKEENPNKIGILFSTIIILASIIPSIIDVFIQSRTDWIIIFLFGSFSLFFSFGLLLNTTMDIIKAGNKTYYRWKRYSKNYCNESKACFTIAIILFIFFIIRLVQVMFL
jgi:hypothetical protein